MRHPQRLTVISDPAYHPRDPAQALVLAGKVLVNEQKVEKPGAPVESDAVLRLLGGDLRYVSRGGLKLEKALEHWKISVDGKVCLDVGASTGGFTDCLLQHGAGRVIAVDTGYGQLDYRLRQDSRVRLLEKTNARYLKADDLGEHADFIAMDVSFIAASLVLPAVIEAAFPAEAEARDGRGIVVLVKPQFESGREHHLSCGSPTSVEARSREGRQCGFESRPQDHLRRVAQRQRRRL